IWDTLHQKSVHLQRLWVPTSNWKLLRYLASYSGLEELTITRASEDDCADFFFDSVVPRHRESLLVLNCPGSYEGRWSFDRRNIILISRLQHLHTLEMTVNWEDVGSPMEDIVVRPLPCDSIVMPDSLTN
ncbi:hypothetical protein B0H11DRAFT_1755033, partial [Mycena galericulata]